MTLRLILDTTALTIYSHGDLRALGIGETLGEVAGGGERFGVPLLCLAEAAAHIGADEADRLETLTHHAACDLLPLPDDWRDLGWSTRMYGGLGRGAARLAAVEYGAYLFTAEPEVYGGPDADGIIAVD